MQPPYWLSFFWWENELSFAAFFFRCCRSEGRAPHVMDVLHFLSCFSRYLYGLINGKARRHNIMKWMLWLKKWFFKRSLCLLIHSDTYENLYPCFCDHTVPYWHPNFHIKQWWRPLQLQEYGTHLWIEMFASCAFQVPSIMHPIPSSSSLIFFYYLIQKFKMMCD